MKPGWSSELDILDLFFQQALNRAHDFRDALLFFQDVAGELRGRQVRDVFLGARILAVEVAAIRQQFGGGNFPRLLIFFPHGAMTRLVPPCNERREFLELDGGGFGVVLPAFRQRLLVIPDFACRAGAVEEQQVRRDAGVGRKHAVRQPDDGVQVEFLEQFFLDAGAHAIAE